MTVLGRHPERTLDDIAGEALRAALADAGASAPDLEAAFYSGMTNGSLQGQIAIPGQVIFSKIGIEGVPVFNVENACASGSSAMHLAAQYIRSGACGVALAIGAEKMNIPDKAKAFAIFDAGWEVSQVERNFETSGGLESKGHPLGATGIGRLHELVAQLRGEAGARQVTGARVAMQENGGGLVDVEEAAVAIHILTQ